MKAKEFNELFQDLYNHKRFEEVQFGKYIFIYTPYCYKLVNRTTEKEIFHNINDIRRFLKKNLVIN